jgi:predicted membrane protein
MSTQDHDNQRDLHRPKGRIMAGFFLLLVGAAFLLKEISFPFFPSWLFTWPMILIVLGIFTGIRNDFRNPVWIVLIIVGGIFLVDEADLGVEMHRFIAPAVIIGIGLVLILRPKRYRNWERKDWPDWKKAQIVSEAKGFETSTSSDDFFESTSVFGGTKKVIVSKNFKGGDITCFMGGCEVDFTQADMQVPAVVDVTQLFGGTKLIVPSHWQVKTEMTAVFGSIEDKRQQPLSADQNKLLILKGTSFFGGIDIRNY